MQLDCIFLERSSIAGAAARSAMRPFWASVFHEGTEILTGCCSCLARTGEKMVRSENGLLTTIAWGFDGRMNDALEARGSVAGASAVALLHRRVFHGSNAADTEAYATRVSLRRRTVPAFAGLGTPQTGILMMCVDGLHLHVAIEEEIFHLGDC